MRTTQTLTATGAALGLLLLPAAAGAQDDEACEYPVATCPQEPVVAGDGEVSPSPPHAPDTLGRDRIARGPAARLACHVPGAGDGHRRDRARRSCLPGAGRRRAILVRRSLLAHVEG